MVPLKSNEIKIYRQKSEKIIFQSEKGHCVKEQAVDVTQLNQTGWRRIICET